MMKRFLIAAAPLAFLASPAAAQDATGTVSIDGFVEGRCLFTLPNATISLGEMSLQGSDASAGRLDTAKVDGQQASLNGWCNSASATMTVEAFPLLNTSPGASGFTNRVDFSADADANGTTGTDDTLVAGGGSAVTVGMFTGDILVTLDSSSAPNNDLLVAGVYTGSVVVTLTPTIELPQ